MELRCCRVFALRIVSAVRVVETQFLFEEFPVVVSQNKGTQYRPPIYYNPYYRDPQKGTPNFGKPPCRCFTRTVTRGLDCRSTRVRGLGFGV